MGSYFSTLRPGGKMHSAVLAALLSVAAAAPQLPAGLSAAACPNYPFCGAVAPADFPVPVVNGEPVAPVLNTVPAQTRFYQESQLVKSPANFPTPVINGQNVAPGLNTVPAQTAAHENHQLIAQQQQLQQLIDAQTIQHRVQQQEIEAARHFGRLRVTTRAPLSSPRLSLDSEHP